MTPLKIRALRDEAAQIKAQAGDQITAAQLDQIEAKLNEADTLEANATRLASVQNRLTKPSTRIEVGAEGFERDPKAGFKHAQEMLAVIAKNHGQAGNDARLKFLAAVGSDEQSGTNGAYGGFFIPKALHGEALTVGSEGDPTSSLCRNIPMETPSISINARVDKNHSTSVTGGTVVYRSKELAAMTSSRAQFEQIDLKCNDLTGLSYVSQQLLNASPSSVAAILAGFPAEFAEKEFREKISGVGVGEYEGILNSPALITVAKESAQAANTVLAKNLGKMMSRCYGYGSAVWMCNHDVLPELMDLGGSDKNVWTPSAVEGVMFQIYGRPLVVTDKCPALSAAGDIMLINWSEYLVGQYGATTSEESIHVRFEYNENCFRFYKMNDGRGWWKSVLTPKAGSTKSPFVILGAR
jgi:HK97 family phage major capsid protein